MKRFRVVQFVVQPVVLVDDGDSLTPLSVSPVSVPAAEWQQFVEHGLDDALNALRAEIEKPAAPAPNRAQRRAKGNGKVSP